VDTKKRNRSVRWLQIAGVLLLAYAVIGNYVALLLQPPWGTSNTMSRTLLLTSIAFFAAATWEVCGLGSTGRMLHPDQAAQPLAHRILVTQSSKLMIEFLFAWSLLLASNLASRKAASAD
jgi:hypothetical protein